MNKYFGFFGYGHFDLTSDDSVRLMEALMSDNYKEDLENLYNELYEKRMG